MNKNYDMQSYRKDKEFLEIARPLETVTNGIENIFKYTSTKKEALETRCQNLFGKGGVRIPLNKVTDAKIGSAFKKYYDSAKKNVAKFEHNHPTLIIEYIR